MQVELVNDASYLMTKVGSISFHLPSSDFIELDDVLYVLGLTNNHISISTMINQRCVTEFDGQQIIMGYHGTRSLLRA